MFLRLYQLLPSSVQRRFEAAAAENAKRSLFRQVEAVDSSLPRTELTERHIRNLRVVLDRCAFLRLLPKQAVAAELGVGAGDFSAQILDISEPTKLHLIDSWMHDPNYRNMERAVRKRFSEEISRGQVVIHRGLSTDMLAAFPNCYFDWVYIDTSHDYDTTHAELELCRIKVKSAGIIAGHDYVTGAWRSWDRYGVIEALHEFCTAYDWEMLLLTHEHHRHLSYAVRAMSCPTRVFKPVEQALKHIAQPIEAATPA